MKKLGTGMTAVSLAGHDTGKRYMIMKAEGEYVYLADGKIRTIENQKKKKVKHILIKYFENLKSKIIRIIFRKYKN